MSMSLPAAMHASAMPAWVRAGVAMATPSTSGSARTSAKSPVTPWTPYRPASLAARSVSTSQTHRTVDPSSAVKLRTRFGPQYPAPTTAIPT